MMTRRTIPLAAMALLLPLLIGGPVADASSELPAPTNTADVVVAHDEAASPPVVSGILLGRHADYDRLVFDISGAIPSYSARYVSAAYSEGGVRVPVRGAAVFVVSLHQVDTTRPPVVPARTNLPTIRDVVGSDQYGGFLNYVIGMSDRNGFRVFELNNPRRLVIDVAHDLPAPTSTEIQSSPTGDDQNTTLTAIRTGTHPSYDRVVFDFSGPSSGLRFVALYEDGVLVVSLGHGTVLDATGALTYTGPWTLHPQMAQVAGIELVGATADGTLARITVRHAAGFRALQLRSPDRIVIDIAH
ncbi:AMIN domain-containing protein [Lentzea sp. NPDC005914]|uniref:AMIN-like domain-containing (lipo)protein n=1 Tax=Lentzea sp. NPDC005914 TaxID=3154572 RepID=UPI0033D1116E